MTSAAISWTPDDLALLAGRQSLVLTVGDDAADEVEIGMVVVDDQLYVRAYRGPGSRWYQASREHGHGRIRIDEVVRDVTLHTDEPGPLERIDQAFIEKYGTAAAGLVTSTAAREATMRVVSAS